MVSLCISSLLYQNVVCQNYQKKFIEEKHLSSAGIINFIYNDNKL